MDIVDRVAVVTGAGSGLGRATALALAKAGARVAVLDRNAQAARSVADEAGAPAAQVTVDVADRASVTAAIAEVSNQQIARHRTERRRCDRNPPWCVQLTARG